MSRSSDSRTIESAWRDAEAGKGDFVAIFVPWYWQEEYRRVPPEGFVLDEDRAAMEGYAHGELVGD